LKIMTVDKQYVITFDLSIQYRSGNDGDTC
jgi:hypothetical protein